MKRLGVLLIILALVSVALYALGDSNPSWSPTSAYTNDTLNCSWTVPPDTTAQNITILQDGSVYQNSYENASLMSLNSSWSIGSSATTKNEVWRCNITLFNETSQRTDGVQITILNSPPVLEGLPAGIFFEESDVGTIFQVDEDQEYFLDANATDSDGDTLTYDLVGSTSLQLCSVVNDNEGLYSCTATQEDIVNNQQTLKNVTFFAEDSVLGSSRKVTFNITPVNDAPTASLSLQSTPVNQSHNYTFDATDEEDNVPIAAGLIFNSSNNEINDSISLVTINGSRYRVEYDGDAPDFDDIGLWPIYINLTDSDGLSAIVSYNFNITSVGRQPYFTSIPNGTINGTQGEALQVNISANDPDENDTISFFDDTDRFAISTLDGSTNTSDAQGQIDFTPSNDDVGIFSVVITIRDQQMLENTTTLTFNITNVNDPPTVHELSYSQSNTQDNQNASNLTGYANTPFVYDVNATDVDTIHGDSLTYSDNSTLFSINSTTGRISFTPSSGDVQSDAYHINITATDSSGIAASTTMILEINSNQPPHFTQNPLQQLNCSTGSDCTLDLSTVTTDPDAGDSVDTYSVAFINGSLPSFSHNSSSGVINFTPAKVEVGNYTINVTIKDAFGAQNSSLLDIQINNTPVAPSLDRYDFGSSTIVETHTFIYDLRGSDDDFLANDSGENLTFTTNLTINHSINGYQALNATQYQATLSFTPQDGDEGNYSVEVNVTDAFGNVASETVSLEVLPVVPPPNITNITPWGAPNAFAINTTYASAEESQFSDDQANFNGSENSTITFGAIVSDTRPLTYNWSLDGQQVQSGSAYNYTKSFGFFGSGSYEVVLNVSNDRFENSSFTWEFIIQNVNRAPQLRSDLSNSSINGSKQFSDYFTGASGGRFYDPDDDLDSNGSIDGEEENSMTFSTSSTCSHATYSISGSDLTVTGTSIGSCTATFVATDSAGATLVSNTVSFNISDVPQGSTETETQVSSGGGGGSSSTSTYIPISQDEETPQAFKLVAPKLVTIYENKSLKIPITVNNTWSDDLEFITLGAKSNASGVTTELDSDFIELLRTNESRTINLIVTNYRLGQNYEVIVEANVSDPEYSDEALILLNSIEAASDGDDVQVRVTFANDLLNQHPECQELKEVLDSADTYLRAGQFSQASALVDSVINGCKYLVSTQQRIEEKPSKINPLINIGEVGLKAIMWAVLAFVLLISIAMLIYYHYSHNPEEDF